MTSAGLEVLWSPVHSDKFIAWGSDIYLYEIGPCVDQTIKGSQSCFKTSDSTQAVLLATNSSHRYVKCIDINPRADLDILLAVGQANGKVVITSFGVSSVEVVGREFPPGNVRQCAAVTWNSWEPNILGVALEKSRTDYGIRIWDVFGCSHECFKPVAEFGLSESANSLTWLKSSILLAGLNNKSITIFDMRDPVNVVNSTLTKAVYGVCADPHSEELVASFYDNQICVWDFRNFEKPITTATQQKNISKIAWCPTRHNLLGSLPRESTVIILHDLQLTTVGTDEVEPTLLERPIQPCPNHKLNSFSWHPTIESRLLTTSLSGNITDYHVVERITLNWLPSSYLVWTHGRRTLKYISNQDSIYQNFEDISQQIKRRALADYGLKHELWQNGELAENESLKNLWYWLYTSRNLVEEGVIKGNSCSPFHPGVLSFFSSERKSESLMMSWSELNVHSYVRMYRSEDRDIALQLCGWRFEKDASSLSNFLERLMVEGSYTRAASIAVFNMKIHLAISILNRGASKKPDSDLGIVAMALAGFSSDIWKMQCSQAMYRLSDPYIRAIFAFLTVDSDRYDAILNENIAVDDKVAFACTFLSDTRLHDYLTGLCDKLTEEGDLSGVLLTGAGIDCVKILQRYLDQTGDIQSVSLLAVRAFTWEVQQDPTVQNWISSYQLFLDSRKLWNQRAHFDIMSNTVPEKVNQSVFISCNFCVKSISHVQGISRSRSLFSRLGPSNNRLKMSSCPNCRKPLPRCAICLVNIGTPSRLNDDKVCDLASWFTWCQTCRHGGHSNHIRQWFSNHSKCPVTGCTCRCMSLDGASSYSQSSQS